MTLQFRNYITYDIHNKTYTAVNVNIVPAKKTSGKKQKSKISRKRQKSKISRKRR
jgi:hypothetical protein